MNHPNQKNTEHIIVEEKSSEDDGEDKSGRSVRKSVTQVNSLSDIFKDTNEKTVRTVLTIGEPGIGKSVHVQKFIKEWAENDNSSFTSRFTNLSWSTKGDIVIFPFKCCELNSVKEKVSMVELLHRFFEDMKKTVISNFEEFRVIFVLDGLDAFQSPLDFDNSITLTDIRQPASVNVLLTNLIRGNLFPSARLWITSQLRLPDKFVDRMTEIRCKYKIVDERLSCKRGCS